MPNIDPLLVRNRSFAAARGHAGVSIMPRHGVFIVTCLDPRVDPGGFLGLDPGDAMVVRNAGGRVTDEVLLDIAFIGALAELQLPEGPLFEVAVVHHTQCGTAFLAAEAFRHDFAARVNAEEATLAGRAVTDPKLTVRADVQLIRGRHGLPGRLSVSGHVYDVQTGLVRTVIPASPLSAGAPA